MGPSPYTLLRSLLAAGLALALLTGCETMGGRDDDAAAGAATVEDRGLTADEMEAEGASAGAMTGGGAFQGHPLDNPEGPLAQRTIYFDFDRAEIKNEYRDIVDAHAAYLARNGGASVTLEGHTDERGSREYNLALGERRAQSVQRVMELLGASPAQLRVVSYGEEQPAEFGHDEAAWAANRRVEIIYKSR
ncbi:MAG: peptidoglycan-associated lipoprotein Pal [Gammaproteobacteria bacterium]|nr:peptidoglycan-associated lipoprotein Pal [Gammaproteobacteria bacterium]